MKHVSGKDLCQVLERKGWTLVRIKGSHFTYTSPDGARTLPTGTQHTIMRQAGLTDADL